MTQPQPQVQVQVRQAQPEIIVRMPEPELVVTQAEPEVSVTLAEPQVEVQQGEAQINVEPDETAEVQPDGGADVEVVPSQPVVLLEATDQAAAQVNLEQAQPVVRFEAADPIIEIEGGGEPQVQFTQSGEPNIQMAQEGEELGEGAEGVVDGAAGVATGATAGLMDVGEWRGDRELLKAPAMEREGFEMVQPTLVSAEELQDAEVYGVNDEEIASVDSVQLGQDGQIQYFVRDVGGFLGIGSRNVAVGFDEATIVRDEGGEHRIYIEATEEQLENLPEHQL